MKKRKLRIISTIIIVMLVGSLAFLGYAAYKKYLQPQNDSITIKDTNDDGSDPKAGDAESLTNPADLKEKIKDDDKLKDYELPLVGGLVNEGQFIDVEFINAKGETYIILAKKLVKKKIEGGKIALQLNYAERQMINYALAEQKASGGRLESAVYIDEKQPAPKTNYPVPNLEIKHVEVVQASIQQAQAAQQANSVQAPPPAQTHAQQLPQAQQNASDKPLIRGGN